MRREPCPESRFIYFHISRAVCLAGAGFLTAFLNCFDFEMRDEHIPATGTDSLDDDIGIHQHDLSALQELRPTSQIERNGQIVIFEQLRQILDSQFKNGCGAAN